MQDKILDAIGFSLIVIGLVMTVLVFIAAHGP
jgi:hypothetical protein